MNKQEYINYIEHKYYELEENSQNGNQIFWTFTNYPADFYENIKSAKIFSKWKLENKPKDLPTFFKEQAPK